MRQTALVALIMAATQLTACSQESKPQQATEQTDQAKTQAVLGSNIVFSVFAARSWTPPETKFALCDKVPNESYYYLKMDGVSLGGGPSVALSDEGGEDVRSALQTGSVFKRRCVKLSPPKGKYLETLLLFQDTGTQNAEEVISGQKPGELDIVLTPSGASIVHPLDFESIGFSTSRLSQLEELQKQGLTVVSEFSGKISIYLEAAGKTWILLLFDVPKSSKTATLQIKHSGPITLHF